MSPPSPSSSGSSSESASFSSDEEQQQPQQEMAPAKTSPRPPKKKPVVLKKKHRPPIAEEEQQQKTKPRQPTASPSPLKKKPTLSDTKKPLPPGPRSAAAPATAAAADSGSDMRGSDSPPKRKPSPTLPRLRGPDPSSSTKPVNTSKPVKPPPAAASQQLPVDKKRKRKQQRNAGDALEGVANAAADGLCSKKPFGRVWAEEDEIALLQGMLDFQEKEGGAHRASDIDSFAAFVSIALQREFSKSQIYEKVRRLRKKYEGNLRRGKKGEDPSFAKPHEQVAFELSKRIWPALEGDVRDYGGDNKGVKTKDGGGKMGSQRVGQSYPMLVEAINLFEKEDGNNLLTRLASGALGSLKPSKAKALEDRWRKHFIAGANYFLERVRLKKDLLDVLVKVLDNE